MVTYFLICALIGATWFLIRWPETSGSPIMGALAGVLFGWLAYAGLMIMLGFIAVAMMAF